LEKENKEKNEKGEFKMKFKKIKASEREKDEN